MLYQFKIDNTGDAREDLVIQVVFDKAGTGQTATIYGPAVPTVTGCAECAAERAAFGFGVVWDDLRGGSRGHRICGAAGRSVCVSTSRSSAGF